MILPTPPPDPRWSDEQKRAWREYMQKVERRRNRQYRIMSAIVISMFAILIIVMAIGYVLKHKQ